MILFGIYVDVQRYIVLMFVSFFTWGCGDCPAQHWKTHDWIDNGSCFGWMSWLVSSTACCGNDTWLWIMYLYILFESYENTDMQQTWIQWQWLLQICNIESFCCEIWLWFKSLDVQFPQISGIEIIGIPPCLWYTIWYWNSWSCWPPYAYAIKGGWNTFDTGGFLLPRPCRPVPSCSKQSFKSQSCR